MRWCIVGPSVLSLPPFLMWNIKWREEQPSISQWRRKQVREEGRKKIGRQEKRVGEILGAATVGNGKRIQPRRNNSTEHCSPIDVYWVIFISWCGAEWMQEGGKPSLSFPGGSSWGANTPKYIKRRHRITTKWIYAINAKWIQRIHLGMCHEGHNSTWRVFRTSADKDGWLLGKVKLTHTIKSGVGHKEKVGQ